MEYNFANRIKTVQPSAIREILKTTQDPNVISFAAGSPAVEAYPVKEIDNITRMILENSPMIALNYSISEGYQPLRTAITKFVNSREGNIVTEKDDVIVVSGAQQGIELTAKCFVNEGDTVLVEEPTFLSAINTFRTYNANVLGVKMEEDGPCIESLEKHLAENQNVKMFYTIPNFQNPTGYTMSLEKRQKIYQLCVKHNVLILEDNPYGEVRYTGQPLPTIKSLDSDGYVIYVGSFSKIIAPGMRIGYILANKAAMQPIVVAKQCSDVHSNILAQMVCERYLSTGNIPAHLASLQNIYRKKATLMLQELANNCGDKVKFSQPEGGLFIWATLPAGTDAVDFCKKAAERGVAVVPGNPFYLDAAAPCNEFRMNFSAPSNQQIIKGCEILGQVIKDYFK